MPKFRSRSHANKDANHDAVKRIFTDCMYYTLDTYMIDCGFDFIAWRAGRTYLVEVKNSDLPPSATRLTDTEIAASKMYPDWVCIFSENQARLLLGVSCASKKKPLQK